MSARLAGRAAPAPPRTAHCLQGSSAGRRISVHARLDDLQGRDAGGGLRAGRASAACGSHSDREDERSRARHGIAYLQQGLRNDASTRSTRPGAPAARAAARVPRSPPACCRSPTAAIWAVPSEIPPTSTTLSACGRRSDWSPRLRTCFPLLGFGVEGPMARTVADVALLLSVMAGPDPRDPGCAPSDPSVFRGPLDRSCPGNADRVVSGSRRASCGPAGSDRPRRAAADVRGARLHRRGRLSGSQRCGVDLPDDSPVSQRGRVRAAAGTVPRSDEARSDRRDRNRPRADEPRRRAGDDPARSAARTGAALSREVRLHGLRR